MLQTSLGPVDLRKPRQPETIKLVNSDKKVTIRKGWLGPSTKQQDETYMTLVKQVMMLGAVRQQIEDFSAKGVLNPETGLPYTKQHINEAQIKLQGLQDGTFRVPPRSLGLVSNMQRVHHHNTKHVLMKRGKTTGLLTQRFFTIESGLLKVFSSNRPGQKPTKVYQLDDNTKCSLEYPTTHGLAEPFDTSYQGRVSVQLPPGFRTSGPLMLYAREARDARSWERAVKMSKYMQVASDKEAIASCVGKVAGSAMAKAWQELFRFAKEIKETRQQVRQLAKRLMHYDICKGWIKLRLLYLQKVETEKRRKQQKDWAAGFLREKMDRISSQTARSTEVVLQTIVSQVQSKFRNYRQDQIMDRNYRLGTAVVTRLQQALTGQNFNACFKCLTREEVLRLALQHETFSMHEGEFEQMHDKNSFYSEIPMALCRAFVHCSEGLSALSFSETSQETSEVNPLGQAGWEHFVQLDFISNLVMHTERQMAKKGEEHHLHHSHLSGVWFTINGPRVGWNRQVRLFNDPLSKAVSKEVVGASHNMSLAASLAKGEKVRYFRVEVSILAAHVPKIDATEEGDLIIDPDPKPEAGSPNSRESYVLITFLGRSFKTAKVAGSSPQYAGRFAAEIPISADANALAALDESELGVDVVEWIPELKLWVTSWAGKLPFWKIFGPQDSIAKDAQHATQTALQTLGLTQARVEDVASMAATVANSGTRTKLNMKLVHHLTGPELLWRGSVDFEVFAQVLDSGLDSKASDRFLSPELQGRGLQTSLFSSQRQAWYDARVGKMVDSGAAGSFVELQIKELRFPVIDKIDESRLFRYKIQASCNGVTSSTISVCRAKDSWQPIIQVDSKAISFQGAPLYIALPPGCWSDESPPEVEILVLRAAQAEAPLLSFRELLLSNGKKTAPHMPWEKVYHSKLLLEGMTVDNATHRDVPLSAFGIPAVEVHVMKGSIEKLDRNPAVIQLDASIRDRDYVRLQLADTSSPLSAVSLAGVEMGLCVGEKAVLRVEEPIRYPTSDIEFRRRFLPGVFDVNLAKRTGAWIAPLRDPSLSHEYYGSGIDKIPNPPAFTQRFLPNNAEDVIPHKYVLPRSELEFNAEARPGVFWRVVEDFAQHHKVVTSTPKAATAGANQMPGPFIVDRLSHLSRAVAVTVLAVYANQTCDVELSEDFVTEWELHPNKAYTMPGSVLIREFEDDSYAAIHAAPPGTGDVGQRYRRRVLLKEVPLSCVQGVQQAGFNIFDAALGSVEEALAVHPNQMGNGFNPRHMRVGNQESSTIGRKGPYKVHAGPLPSDAGPICNYEWSLHLHAANEDEMYHFITVLRQAVRLNLHQQVKSFQDYKKKSAAVAKVLPYQLGPLYTSSSGHLEVVLVEARHLVPPRVQQEHSFKHVVEMAGQAAKQSILGDLQTHAVFKLRGLTMENLQNKGLEEGFEDMVYRGTLMQTAPPLTGLNPVWAQMPELQGSNGWVFKSPLIEPDHYHDIYFELSLHSRISRIGLTRMSLKGNRMNAGAPAVKLIDEQAPFANLWLPVASVDSHGHLVPSLHGEIHIMTMWVPKNPTAKSKRLPKNVQGWRLHQLKPKILQGSSALRDETYDVQTVKVGYNPNAFKDTWPPRKIEDITKHIESMDETLPYLQCLENQQKAMWDEFVEKLYNMTLDSTQHQTLSIWRQHWMRTGSQLAFELDDLLRRGVPPSRRQQVWLEILSADLLMQVLPGAGSLSADGRPQQDAIRAYKSLVEYGTVFRTDGMLQLNEDLVGAASWETSQRPDLLDRHLKRLKRAADVCTALMVFSYDLSQVSGNLPINFKDTGRGHDCSPVAYCESLLVIAFFLLLAQGRGEQEGTKRTDSATQKPTKQQLDEEEVRAFWMLYSLSGSSISNAPFRDYFGVPRSNKFAPHPPLDPYGAMDDIQRLNHCVAKYEPELWVHMNSIGFHLSTVFYGAFMRLFAFLLPTPTLFRFWDLLFADAARPDLVHRKPARHSLIDLAYGSLQSCKSQLMQAESSNEARDIIVSFLEKLHDPSAAVEVAYAAECTLWEAALQVAASPLIAAPHTRDYAHAAVHWEAYLEQFQIQNKVLKDLIAVAESEATGAHPVGKMGNQQGNQVPGKATRAGRDVRVTTSSVMYSIIPSLHNAFMGQGDSKKGPFCGMLRQVPQKAREIGPSFDNTWLGEISTFFHRLTAHHDPMVRKTIPLIHVPGTAGEPDHLELIEFRTKTQQILGQSWINSIDRIYDAFKCEDFRQGAMETNSRLPHSNSRLSLNEFEAALVCFSKGTVGEKALALFTLFGSVQPAFKVQHVVPISTHAMAVVEKIDGKQKMMEGHLVKAPKAEDVPKTIALHFKIFTARSGSPGQEMLFGEVFVSSLRPYVSGSISESEPQAFTIWGTDKRLPPGMTWEMMASQDQSGAAGAGELMHDGHMRPSMGEVTMSIKWIESSPTAPEIGQLSITLHHIAFSKLTVDAPQWKNPRVELRTYDETLNGIQIKRWDPRTDLKHLANTLSAHFAFDGAYGDFLDFPATMRVDAFGHLFHKIGESDHGWDAKEGLWKWGPKWGQQHSVANVKFRKDFCAQSSSAIANTISLQSCRLVTQYVLNRCLHCVTNRQAALISDQIFCRSGAVPGIIDAILVQGGNSCAPYKSIKHLKETGKSHVSHHDVKHELILAHEEQVTMNGLGLNLCPGGEDGKALNLTMLHIKDPFPLQKKVLWIRWCRSGDGQRFNQQIQVDEAGNFHHSEITLDMPSKGEAGKLQMHVTRDEFLTCFLSSPLLCEGLRRLSSTDTVVALPADDLIRPGQVPEGRSIKLDVTITDPAQELAEEDFMDVMDVKQGVLLELWDWDRTSKDDFLGECWLPNLSTIGSNPRQFVLEIQNAPKDQEGSTRPSSKKNIEHQCKGLLYVEASWKMPAQALPEPGAGSTMDQRVKYEEAKHTGKLILKIIKAENIRVADFRRGSNSQGGSDPYLCVYIQNQAFHKGDKLPFGFTEGGWRGNAVEHTSVFTTTTKKGTLNPVWNESKEFLLQTGAFEKRAKHGIHFDITKKQQQRTLEAEQIKVLGEKMELKLFFWDDTQNKESGKPGHRHNVKIYLDDSMNVFKDKVVQACQVEAQMERDAAVKAQYQAAAREISVQHAVMIFVPSQRLRELAQDSKNRPTEYKRLYRIEFQDPSSWQPLHEIRTFNHYASKFGFGMNVAQCLRISEGSDQYATKNTRFRAFEQEQQRFLKRIEDTNTENECFGYAKFTHKQDNESEEWRQVMVERGDAVNPSKKYKASFVYTPLLARQSENLFGPGGRTEGLDGPAAQALLRVDVGEDAVLLAPMNPKIHGSASREHRDLLGKASAMHEKGATDAQIVAALNAELTEKYKKSKAADEQEGGGGKVPPPQPITIFDVQYALKLAETKALGR